jgi:hypothetical protein
MLAHLRMEAYPAYRRGVYRAGELTVEGNEQAIAAAKRRL